MRLKRAMRTMKLIDVAELSPKLQGSMGSAVERLLGFDDVNACYERAQAGTGPQGFLRSCLDELGIEEEILGHENMQAIVQGPCVVVANHPFGGVEAILFLHMLRQVRPDAIVMANYLLQRVPEVAEGILPVDPFGREHSVKSNIKAMRQAVQHLRGGGVLGVFPSGTVSHWHLGQASVTDPEWSPHIASLIQKAGVPVLPVFFHGRNGWGFQLAGLIHPMIRTALLPRELLNKRGRSIKVTVGRVISQRQLLRFGTKERLTSFVRASTYLLKDSHVTEEPQMSHTEMAPVDSAIDPEILAREIAALPSEAKILTKQGFEVYLIRREQGPFLVKEIGRLREVTFRSVGEGTGKSSDLDAFDDHYEHLLLWSAEEEAIVGAYRMARVDRVLETHGISGLYTATLYKFKPGFLERLGGSVELGRSFVVKRHQKQRHSLMLLWCGICAFVSVRPRYHTLFGPVSMSQDYTSLSKQLLVWFFKRSHRHPILSRLVKAHRPFEEDDTLSKQKSLISDCIQSVDDVSALMSEFEQDGKGVPVLFKQYLKMNALLLSFSMDDSFSNVLDGLVVADLRTASPRILRRYFGEEGLARFLDFHQGSLERDAESPESL